MRNSSTVLWHSIMNTYQIGNHARQPEQYVFIHNRFYGQKDDKFLVKMGRLPGVISVEINQEVESPAHSFTIVCEDKDGMLSPDYHKGKLVGIGAFRGHLDSPWVQQIQANTKLEVHFGYGTETVRIMTGLIDSVAINAKEQTITISGRSMYKLAIDNTCRPYPGYKHTIPHDTMHIRDGLNRLFSFAGLNFKSIPIVDEQTNETFIVGEPMGERGEKYDEVIKPLVNSVFHYLYELPNGTIEQREVPEFSQGDEAVFTVDDDMHIQDLSYTYDDTEIYGTVIVTSNRMQNSFTSSFLTTRFLNGQRRELVIDIPWANSTYKRRLAAQARVTEMLYKIRAVSITIPANPLLELYDTIRIQEKISTVTHNYHIRSITYSFDGNGFTQTLTCALNTGFEKPSTPPPPQTHLPTVNARTENVTLGIWDNGAVDLDVITIRLNGKNVSSNLILKASADTINLSLKKGRNIVEFIGVSAGRTGNLTASMYVEDANGNLLTPTELILDMPRTNVNNLGFYRGAKPVRKWVIVRE